MINLMKYNILTKNIARILFLALTILVLLMGLFQAIIRYEIQWFLKFSNNAHDVLQDYIHQGLKTDYQKQVDSLVFLYDSLSKSNVNIKQNYYH